MPRGGRVFFVCFAPIIYGHWRETSHFENANIDGTNTSYEFAVFFSYRGFVDIVQYEFCHCFGIAVTGHVNFVSFKNM